MCMMNGVEYRAGRAAGVVPTSKPPSDVMSHEPCHKRETAGESLLGRSTRRTFVLQAIVFEQAVCSTGSRIAKQGWNSEPVSRQLLNTGHAAIASMPSAPHHLSRLVPAGVECGCGHLSGDKDHIGALVGLESKVVEQRHNCNQIGHVMYKDL